MGRKLHVEFIFAADPAVIIVKVSSTPALGFRFSFLLSGPGAEKLNSTAISSPFNFLMIEHRNEPLSLRRTKRIKKEVFWP